MNAEALLQTLQAQGCTLRARDGRLQCRPAAPANLRDAIDENRSDLLRLLSDESLAALVDEAMSLFPGAQETTVEALRPLASDVIEIAVQRFCGLARTTHPQGSISDRLAASLHALEVVRSQTDAKPRILAMATAVADCIERMSYVDIAQYFGGEPCEP